MEGRSCDDDDGLSPFRRPGLLCFLVCLGNRRTLSHTSGAQARRVRWAKAAAFEKAHHGHVRTHASPSTYPPGPRCSLSLPHTHTPTHTHPPTHPHTHAHAYLAPVSHQGGGTPRESAHTHTKRGRKGGREKEESYRPVLTIKKKKEGGVGRRQGGREGEGERGGTGGWREGGTARGTGGGSDSARRLAACPCRLLPASPTTPCSHHPSSTPPFPHSLSLSLVIIIRPAPPH